jgi:hypothetical protein
MTSVVCGGACGATCLNQQPVKRSLPVISRPQMEGVLKKANASLQQRLPAGEAPVLTLQDVPGQFDGDRVIEAKILKAQNDAMVRQGIDAVRTEISASNLMRKTPAHRQPQQRIGIPGTPWQYLDVWGIRYKPARVEIWASNPRRLKEGNVQAIADAVQQRTQAGYVDLVLVEPDTAKRKQQVEDSPEGGVYRKRNGCCEKQGGCNHCMVGGRVFRQA